MTEWLERLLGLDGPLIYLVIGALVFAEDALFIGFLVPGETAAILGGVAASLDRVSVVGLIVVVTTAAILGDSAGYAIGRWLGPRLLCTRPLRWQHDRLARAQRQLAERGGLAVFVGRFVTFLHAVTPFLAGVARMRYPRFLAFNVAGGVVWGTGTVLLGYLAGASYAAIARTAGHAAAGVAAVLAVAALLWWRVRRRRRECAAEQEQS
ncbi:membrane protein DedA, SNARE-associated domain [Micromonospora pattaloongensis]|uniref:Membrane protein DedA, SNARE-associated domain n=1 Tax=Micromonospora pattaloongensis TaxID=405436 RepID=A0A1H3JHT8_9ACTN|nr:DedA family protein [Micromonospora pattaloongensis]SDY39065.1 membrane protein DedA, SNARE-associated domain [Micromonospora pattaloongensis]